ncbi:MAG: hypothetical protein PHY93_20160 [Bacteriovorax sp.]|nr:hypothetical protein [Bacteriovorax sp.]
MKRAISVLFLIANLQSVAFGYTFINEEKCSKLAVQVSTVAFSFDSTDVLYSPYKLNKDKGVEYVNKTRTALANKMMQFCKSNIEGVFIEDFKDKFHGTCSNECQEQSSMFSDPLIGDNYMKRNADTVCLSICNKTKEKLDMFIEGIELGKNLAKKASGDCSTSVSDSGRSKVNTKNVDSIIEHAGSSSSIKK